MKILGAKIVWGSFWVGAASATLFWILFIIALYCWMILLDELGPS